MAETYSDYPQSAVNNAKRGIKLNEEQGNKCATNVGKQRARDIVAKRGFSLSVLKRVYSYLSRAKEYYNPSDDEACGTISYLLWGGESMRTWAKRKLEKIEKEEKNIDMKKIDKRHIDRIEETETHYVIHYLKDEEYEEDEEMVEEVIEEEEVAKGDHDEDMYRNLTKEEGFERRTFTTTEMRLDSKNERRVVGYASVFNSLSENLGGFRELISERAFDDVMEDSVVALINHDMNYPLARTDNNTLTLSVDSKGLRYSFDVPEGLSYGNDLLINLRAGNISQSSFGFIVEEDSWERKDGEHIRTIEKVSRLIDVSPVTIPAYPEATAQVSKVAQRNLNTQKEKHEYQKEEQDLHKRNLTELKLKIIKNKKNG